MILVTICFTSTRETMEEALNTRWESTLIWEWERERGFVTETDRLEEKDRQIEGTDNHNHSHSIMKSVTVSHSQSQSLSLSLSHSHSHSHSHRHVLLTSQTLVASLKCHSQQHHQIFKSFPFSLTYLKISSANIFNSASLHPLLNKQYNWGQIGNNEWESNSIPFVYSVNWCTILTSTPSINTLTYACTMDIKSLSGNTTLHSQYTLHTLYWTCWHNTSTHETNKLILKELKCIEYCILLVERIASNYGIPNIITSFDNDGMVLQLGLIEQ